ncbi:DNA/RNA nuclease SfsA [Paenarthrobacter nitroguajacolicus]|uniref:DNA/RNA nuclease SfsA n=1 Tax=Paenarthrobacter nitroguajacolicus TaxID=211146 RepID=UPI001C4D941D
MTPQPNNFIQTFDPPLLEGTIVRRPNRFIIEVELDGELIPCHCPTTGRIGNLVLDGLACLLSPAENPARKTRYTVEAIAVDRQAQYPWIGINQNAANKYIEAALTSGALDGIVPVESVLREQKLGISRLDFLVNNDTFVEVKTPLQNLQIVLPPNTLTRKQPAFNSTERMVKHVAELGGSLDSNQRAIMLLCFMYDNPGFRVEASTRKSQVAAGVSAAVAQGIEIWQVNLLLTPNGVTVGATTDLTAQFA